MNGSLKKVIEKLMVLTLFINILMLFLIRTEEYSNISKTNTNSEGIRVEMQSNIESIANADTEGLFFKAPAAKPQNTHLVINKAKRTLELYGDNQLAGRFRIALGGHPEGHKRMEGDSKTPEGSYYICTRLKESKFTRFLGLSYPNIQDASQGLSRGAIGQDTFNRIKYAIEHQECPPWNTPLGGTIGIHGGGSAMDWTLGCIALSDEDIEILWQYTPIGTPVEIVP